MKLLGARIDAWAARLSLVLLLTAGGAAQTSRQAADLADADRVIEGLRQTTRDLNEAVKHFHSDLDVAVARYDRGYRAAGVRLVPGADSDLAGGTADVILEATRKLAAFRMLAARNEKYEPPPVVDMDGIQHLVAEAHQRVADSASVLRRLLVVSVKDFDPRRDAEAKARHDHLLKERAATEEAAKQAWLALPIDLPEPDSSEESSQKAWDLLSRGWSNGARTAQSAPAPSSAQAPVAGKAAAVAIPIRIEKRRRVTLVSALSYRMAVTDSGIEDADGRSLFYQEEWIQRGISVIRMRWRVAVDTATGEHILVKRYPAIELRGELDDVYRSIDRYSLWYLEPPDETDRSSPEKVEVALSDLGDARAAVRAAVDEFQNATRASLARHDRDRLAAGMPLLDAGLAPPIRESLYAIRAHLGGVRTDLDAETNVWQSLGAGERAVAELESVASWANRVTEAQIGAAAEWEGLLARSEKEIDLFRATEIEAAAALPPNSSQAEARFPALQRGVIVRIRRPTQQNALKGLILCRQEIWHMENSMPGMREVRRTATLVAVDPQSGSQTVIGGKTKYYPVDAGGLLEQIFDQYAAEDLPIPSI